MLHQLLDIFQLTCLKLIVNYSPKKESYDLYSVLDNQRASYDTFSGHYIQSWRKFEDFSRPGRTKTTVRWLSGRGRNLVRTCKPLTNLSRTSTFLNFMSSVWVRNLARLFRQELLGFKQPNLIWCLSEGQVDKKIFLWKVWTQESFLLLWRLCEPWRSTFTVFVWKITVKWNRSMLNKHTLCQSGFRTTALRPSESARLQIYSTDVINTRKGEKTLIYVLKKITITLFCRILQNKGKNIIPCKSWGRGCWNVNNIISCNVLENQKCTFFISSKLNLIHKAVVAGLYFLGQP